MTDTRLHLNLVDSSRQLFELDSDATVQDNGDWVLGAGGSSHPAISNAAFRRDDDLDATELVTLARDFFAARGRGFSVWARTAPEDRDLIEAAEAEGLEVVFEMPEMVLGDPVEEPPLPSGAELSRLTLAEQADDYWQVAIAAYASIGFPAEVFSGYTDHDGLLAENVVAFIAYLDGSPVSIAMTIVSHGVAGVYWVGSLEAARGKGLGRAVTAAATNVGFEMGAEVASLQASVMGKPIYLAMGYETAYDYKLLMSPAP